MKKTYSKIRQRYFIKLLYGVPFPPEPLPEKTQKQRDEARAVFAQLTSMAIHGRTIMYRI